MMPVVRIKTYCSSNITNSEIHFEPILDSTHEVLNLTYTKVSSGPGGRFWMQIESKYLKSAIDIPLLIFFA